MRQLLILFVFFNSMLIKGQDKNCNVNELENSGYELIGKEVTVKAQFGELSNTWVNELPWVLGKWESPEGLKKEYFPQEANKWLGFSIHSTPNENNSYMFQMCFASKEKFKVQLLSLKTYTDIIEIKGTIFNYKINNYVGLLVNEIRVITDATEDKKNKKGGFKKILQKLDSINIKINNLNKIDTATSTNNKNILIISVSTIIGLLLGLIIAKNLWKK
ncbi:MAG: hypothetical protein HY738_21800 [Bacteroidia bacterium]|nr:hypothetical protein [Bacteroidia bacterium]